MSALFDPSDSENWCGGYYEAGIVVGSKTSPHADDMLLTAIRHLWSNPALKAAAIGKLADWCWTNSPDLNAFALGELYRVYGVFEHPTLGALPFTSVVVREEVPDGDDWLYAGVPLGGLAPSEGFPFGGSEHSAAARSWREPLERSLAELVLSICEVVPIEIAAISWEIAGNIDRAAASDSNVRRSVGYVCKEATGYRVLPTTIW